MYADEEGFRSNTGIFMIHIKKLLLMTSDNICIGLY